MEITGLAVHIIPARCYHLFLWVLERGRYHVPVNRSSPRLLFPPYHRLLDFESRVISLLLAHIFFYCTYYAFQQGPPSCRPVHR